MFIKGKNLQNENNIKLNNIIEIAKDILNKCETYELHPIYNLIRIINDSYTNKYMMDFLSQNSDNYIDNAIRLNKIFFNKIKLNNENLPIDKIVFKNKVINSTEIDFSVDSIIASPWSRFKFVENICNIGEGLKYGSWNNYNQNSILILPLGIFILNGGGNHSVSIAVSEHKGKISCSNIYNIDYLYDNIYFDGTNYRNINNNLILVKNCCFQYGTIFEVGRLIREFKVNYKNIQLY